MAKLEHPDNEFWQAGFTVALVGPDGAGKSTVTRHLIQALPFPAKYIFMGVSAESSNFLLPTTWLNHQIRRFYGAPSDNRGPLDPALVHQKSTHGVKHMIRTVKNCVGLINRFGEEWYRQILSWYFQYRGYVVVYDRHFYIDYYDYDIAAINGHRSALRRIHGWMLHGIYPKPDLVIYLDAPGTILHERKGEGSPELLERRRLDYLNLQNQLKYFVVVDAAQPLDTVVRDVREHVLSFHQTRLASPR